MMDYLLLSLVIVGLLVLALAAWFLFDAFGPLSSEKKAAIALLDDWMLIVKKAWSIRFMALAMLLNGCEAILPIVNEGAGSFLSPLQLAMLNFAIVAAAFGSRLVTQQGISK